MKKILVMLLLLCSMVALSADAVNSADLLRKAQTGDAEAQYILGYAYSIGDGVEEDIDEAIKWFRKAALQGYAPAQYELGRLYRWGGGIELDLSEALKWFRMAAEQDYMEAQCDLAEMYFEGKGVSQNYTEAAKWFHKAALQGYVAAQHSLFIMYYCGNGVERDYSEALKWIRRLVDHGEKGSEFMLGWMCYHGQGAERDYSEAAKWLLRVADDDYCANIAYMILGMMYRLGQGVEKDYSEALKWYRKAADCEEDPDISLYLLGLMYYKGEIVAQDYAEAVKCYHKAADYGSAAAQYCLAEMCRLGQGVPRDDSEADNLLSELADIVKAIELSTWGVVYHYGLFTEQDYTEAMKWFRIAADQRIPEAQYFLGLYHAQGLGVPADSEEAYFWLFVACANSIKDDYTYRTIMDDVAGDPLLSGFKRPCEEDAVRLRDETAKQLSPEQKDRIESRAKRWLAEHKKE